MTDTLMLAKLIDLAILNGWQSPDINNDHWNLILIAADGIYADVLLFNRAFAKAIFGTKQVRYTTGSLVTGTPHHSDIEAWKYHGMHLFLVPSSLRIQYAYNNKRMV